MNIKQLSLIALLAAPVFAQAGFSKDELIRKGSLSALIASPFFAVWSIYHAQKNIAERDALEASVPGLTQALEEARADAEKFVTTVKGDFPASVDKAAVYQKFLSQDSSLYQELMQANSKSRRAVAATLASIAAGALSWAVLHPAEAQAATAPVVDLP